MASLSAIRSAEPWARSLLRFVVGLTFSCHGFQKLFGLFGGHRVAHLFSLMGLAGVLECFGGILLIVGLFTVPVAFLLSGEMAVAYFRTHFPRASSPSRTAASWQWCIALSSCICLWREEGLQVWIA